MKGTFTVDARGLSCPQPALMAKQALGKMAGGQVEVWVDSTTSRDNVTRIAERAGWAVSAEPQPDGGFRLVLTK
jgi:tRNA 2-thiouridine synthesizing protein A